MGMGVFDDFCPPCSPLTAGGSGDVLRDVRFMMNIGVVFKRNGVMMPGDFCHGGPANGWNIR